MPGPVVVAPPFSRRNDESLSHLFATVGAALDPDQVELTFRFHPLGKQYRRRYAGRRLFPLREVRGGAEPHAPEVSLVAVFALPELVEGQAALLRRAARPWTGAERMRFELVRPFLSQLLASLARNAADVAPWLLAAADKADMPILFFDDEGTLLYANAAADALLGDGADVPLAVLLGERRETPLLPHLAKLAAEPDLERRERLALSNGRLLEARLRSVKPENCEGEAVRMITLQERAGLTIDDVRPYLHGRGVTDREADVVGGVLQGLRNAEIAERLFICEYTVKDHLKHVFSKLDVDSRGGLIRALYAMPCGPEAERVAGGNGRSARPAGQAGA